MQQSLRKLLTPSNKSLDSALHKAQCYKTKSLVLTQWPQSCLCWTVNLMQNEQIWVAEFQPGITPRLCQGSQNLEFLRKTTEREGWKQKHMLHSWRGRNQRKSFHLSWENTLATPLTLGMVIPSPKFGFYSLNLLSPRHICIGWVMIYLLFHPFN